MYSFCPKLFKVFGEALSGVPHSNDRIERDPGAPRDHDRLAAVPEWIALLTDQPCRRPPPSAIKSPKVNYRKHTDHIAAPSPIPSPGLSTACISSSRLSSIVPISSPSSPPGLTRSDPCEIADQIQVFQKGVFPMPYITCIQPPRCHQVTLEEILAGPTKGRALQSRFSPTSSPIKFSAPRTFPPLSSV